MKLVLDSVKKVARLQKPPVRIVRGKNRMSNPTGGGWADVLLNLEFLVPGKCHFHVAELQIIHQKMMVIRSSEASGGAFGGHGDYDSYRAVLELFELLGLEVA